MATELQDQPCPAPDAAAGSAPPPVQSGLRQAAQIRALRLQLEAAFCAGFEAGATREHQHVARGVLDALAAAPPPVAAGLVEALGQLQLARLAGEDRGPVSTGDQGQDAEELFLRWRQGRLWDPPEPEDAGAPDADIAAAVARVARAAG